MEITDETINNGYHMLNKLFYEDLVDEILSFVGFENICMNLCCGSTKKVKDNLCEDCYKKLRICDRCKFRKSERFVWKYTKERGYRFKENPKGFDDLTDKQCNIRHDRQSVYRNKDLEKIKIRCNCHKKRYKLCVRCYNGLYKGNPFGKFKYV